MVLACYVWVREYNNIPLDIDIVKGLVHTPDHLDHHTANNGRNLPPHGKLCASPHETTPHTPKTLGSYETNTAVDEVWTIMRPAVKDVLPG